MNRMPSGPQGRRRGAAILLAAPFLFLGAVLTPPATAVAPAAAGTPCPAGTPDGVIAGVRRAEAEAHTRFLKRLEDVLETHFGAAEARVPDALDRLAGTTGMVKLVCKMAADQVRGTDTAGEAVAAVIEETLGVPCSAGEAAVEELLAEHRHELAALDNGLRAALAASLGPTLPAVPEGAAGEAGSLNPADLEQQARTLALQTVLNQLSLAVDAITLELIRPVLSTVALRIATGAGLTTALIVADGPLPLADVAGVSISLVCIGWSAADLYHAQTELRPRLEKSLRDTVAACRERVAADARQRSALWRSLLEHTRTDLTRRMEEDRQ